VGDIPMNVALNDFEWSQLSPEERRNIRIAAQRAAAAKRGARKKKGFLGSLLGSGSLESDSDSDGGAAIAPARSSAGKKTKPAVGRLGTDGLMQDIDKKKSGKSRPGAPPARAGPGAKSAGDGPAAKGEDAAPPPPAEAEAAAEPATQKKKKRVKKSPAPPAASVTLAALQRWEAGAAEREREAGERALFQVGALGGWPTPWATFSTFFGGTPPPASSS